MSRSRSPCLFALMVVVAWVLPGPAWGQATAMICKQQLPATGEAIVSLSAKEDARPKNFKMTVGFGCGGGPLISWSATITGDGKVVQEYDDRATKEKVRKEFALTAKEMQGLFDKVRQADFANLKERYAGPTEDGGYALEFKVRWNEMSHIVAVWDPDHQKDAPDVQRLMILWNDVLRKVPSPNPEQRPEAPKEG